VISDEVEFVVGLSHLDYLQRVLVDFAASLLVLGHERTFLFLALARVGTGETQAGFPLQLKLASDHPRTNRHFDRTEIFK
jgi:hypothetical protein